VPLLLRVLPRLQAAFPGVKIKLRGDAGFALPLLYEFCEFFGIQYALGIPANCVFQHRAEPRQKQLKRRYRRTQLPQRSFSSFRHRARSWSHQRRICYKAEHTAAGTNLRFLVTNGAGRASQVFAFYNDRGECENRIEEFKNGLVPGILESTGTGRAVRVGKCGTVLGALGPWLEGPVLGEMGESAPWGT
jgi:hypothetical protein